MLPSIARYLIRTFTEVGDWVCDPMAGIATTVVEAMHLRRHGIGVEYEARWAALAIDNLRLAASHGATGTGQIVQGDSRRLPALVPPELHGRIALVITSPPYGPSTHGHARTPGPRRGKVRKINHQYGGIDNLAYRDPTTSRMGSPGSSPAPPRSCAPAVSSRSRPALSPPRRADRHPRHGRRRRGQRRPPAARGVRCAHRGDPRRPAHPTSVVLPAEERPRGHRRQ
jgi:hypothetical protein